MDNAQLVGLSRQVTLQRHMDIIANNMANASTVGFKARGMQFGEYLMQNARTDALSGPARRVSYVVDKGAMLDFSNGPIERTGSPLDIALRDQSLLAVKTPAGERYTRNGSLSLNAQGQLVTSDGHLVQGANGTITADSADGPLEITADGVVGNKGGTITKLKIVSVADPRTLTNLGGNLFGSSTPLPPAASPNIAVGAVEHSNVQPVLAMSRLIEINRAYTTLASMMQNLDNTHKSAIERLAAVPT